jgi:hypothetical protein
MKTMEHEYPLYPNLSEEGANEAEFIIGDFKKKLSKAAEEAIGSLYSGIIPYIESDSWQNFRNQMMDGFKNYNNRKIQGAYDFKEIRAEIFKDFKDEIIIDLNQDIWEENQTLKQQIEDLKELHRNMQTRY